MMGTTLEFNKKPALRQQCFFFVCMLLYFAAHLYLINADTPVNFGAVRFDSGAYCDEGYKTLDARNWALYGSIKWTDTDEYPGWLSDSPLTVWLNYVAFKCLGVSLFSARLVSLFFAMGSCLLFYRLLTREYGYLPALWGTLILVLHPLFVVYGRLAIFEIKLVFFALLGLYLLPLEQPRKRYFRLRIVASILSFVAAYCCKPTVLIIFVVFLLFGLVLFLDRLTQRAHTNKVIVGVAAITLSAIFIISAIPDNQLPWLNRIQGRNLTHPLIMLKELLVLDMFLMSPALGFLALLGAGFLFYCLIYKVSFRRLDLLMALWFLVPTLFFTSFKYHPSRYYLVVLPAMIWLVVFTFLKIEKITTELLLKPANLYGIALLSLSIFLGLIHFGANLLKSGQTYSAALAAGKSLFALIGLSLFYNSGVHNRSPFSYTMKHLRIFVCAVLVVSLSLNVSSFVTWAAAPNYQLLEAFERIDSLGRDSVLAGDWAPQFCIETQTRVIYSSWEKPNLHRNELKLSWLKFGQRVYFNLSNLKKLCPTHLVIVEGVDEEYLQRIDSIYPGSRSNSPVLRFPYAGTNVSVYEFNIQN